MRIHTELPLTVAPVVGRIPFPGHSVTVVVKGLFRLEAGRLQELLDDDELAFPTGDIPRFEDEDEHSEIRYASDFAFYKPRADLMLVGRCHPPGGRAVPSCRITFQVGQVGRSLQVYGDRWWAASGAGSEMTDPVPFSEMELSWERAYGGPECADNPVGRGNRAITLEDGRAAWPLPNIEYPERRISSPSDRPAPAGFGPIPQGWEPRSSMVGSYGDEWLRTRWPWFPEDLDWGFFNAAPSVLQADGFLHGDEEIYLENLHPEEPEFRTRLPGLRVRCFLHRLPSDVASPPPTEKGRAAWSPPPRGQMEFEEVPLVLDTLWVDAEQEKVALVWRGHAPVRDEEFSDVRDLMVVAEPLAEPEEAPDEWRAAFWKMLDEEEGAFEEEDEVDEEPTPEAAEEVEDEEAEEDEELELDLPFDPDARLREQMEEMGIDPDNPPEPTPEDLEKAKEFFREQGMDHLVALLEGEEEDEWPEDEEERAGPWTRERVAEKYAEDGDLRGLALRGLDLSEMTLDEAALMGADLTGANLARASLAGADLTGATLSRADLAGGKLEGAVLAGCDLTDAVLAEVQLKDADLSGARMDEADLSGADLSGALLDEARLVRANLTKVQAPDAVFSGADLTEAVLIRAELDGADFTGAVLDGADARHASLESAEFGGVSAVEATFAWAVLTELRAADALDLSRINLTQADAVESVWSGATLEGAVMAWAVLEGADFSGANLKGADLYACHLSGARFGKANLQGARLAAADAFQANFEKADLFRADLRGGNFYEAEFLDAVIEEAAFDGANLTMTKLA